MLWVAELTKSWKIKTIQYLIIPFWILILEYFYSTFRNHIILELCLRKTEKLKIKLSSKHLLLMLKLLLLRLNICKAFRLCHHWELTVIPYFTDVNMNNYPWYIKSVKKQWICYMSCCRRIYLFRSYWNHTLIFNTAIMIVIFYTIYKCIETDYI